MMEDALFDIKIQTVMDGTLPCYAKSLRELPCDNTLTIINFIMSLNSELNPSSNYRRDMVRMLCLLSKFYDNEKKFETMSRQNILNFLDSYRKTETVDPFHKWIGRIHFSFGNSSLPGVLYVKISARNNFPYQSN